MTRKKVWFAAGVLALMCLLPLGAGIGLPQTDSPTAAMSVSSVADSMPATVADTVEESSAGLIERPEAEAFVWEPSDEASRQTISDRELVIGAVAYEMLPGSCEEALKAQAVACYSHFCARRQQGDSTIKDGYYSPEQLQERWGEAYAANSEKIVRAVDAVFPEVLLRPDGTIADTAYHAISSGTTEDAAEIFGKADPLLCPVASPFDAVVPGYLSQERFTPEELKKAVTPFGTPQELSPEQAVVIVRSSAAGSILEAQVYGVSVSGQQLRQVLGLRSAHCTVRYVEGEFVFDVKGYGHGVGMSQAGAEEMAKQGADYREILRHYYGKAPVVKS